MRNLEDGNGLGVVDDGYETSYRYLFSFRDTRAFLADARG